MAHRKAVLNPPADPNTVIIDQTSLVVPEDPGFIGIIFSNGKTEVKPIVSGNLNGKGLSLGRNLDWEIVIDSDGEKVLLCTEPVV